MNTAIICNINIEYTKVAIVSVLRLKKYPIDTIRPTNSNNNNPYWIPVISIGIEPVVGTYCIA